MSAPRKNVLLMLAEVNCLLRHVLPFCVMNAH